MSAKSTDLVVTVDQLELVNGVKVEALRVWCILCRHSHVIVDSSTVQQLLDAGAHECPDRGVPL